MDGPRFLFTLCPASLPSFLAPFLLPLPTLRLDCALALCPPASPLPHPVQGRPMLLVLLHFGTQFHLCLWCASSPRYLLLQSLSESQSLRRSAICPPPGSLPSLPWPLGCPVKDEEG